eukprot:TRINITY_DN78369_c0_g1_i1.p1 TRINITY_DN78369_c0_g1~~TRINITY_DN78369_c0_g1_i1.p1  ORF type:complete len:452 (+),score=87.55 TRINITY_DN78369_c0_g1_i1:82-1437(+)
MDPRPPPRLPRRATGTSGRSSQEPCPKAPQQTAMNGKGVAKGEGRALSQPQKGSQHRTGSIGQGSSSAPSTSRASAGSSSTAGRPASQPSNAKAPAPRQLEAREGFSMLAPNPQKHRDLVRRQKIADKARPKPKAADIRFSEVADPSTAMASDADREAARQRWIAEMQAKADPNQIRRAVREQKEQQDERERDEQRAKRQEFEQQWYEREAQRQAAQQVRTAAVNASARQHWSEVSLPASQPMAAEPVMPPEEVDFSAVRRRMAAERAGRGAALISGRVLGRSSSPAPVPATESAARRDTAASQPPPRSRCGELALSAQAAIERQRHHAAEQIAAQQESRAIVAAQDAEYEISLLHDRLKTLESERATARATVQELREKMEVLRQRKTHAEQRLARYGENPKLRSELEEIEQASLELQSQTDDAEHRLGSIDVEFAEKEEILAAVGVSSVA